MKNLLVLLMWSIVLSGCSSAKIRHTFEWAKPRVDMWDCKFQTVDHSVPEEGHSVWSCKKAEW